MVIPGVSDAKAFYDIGAGAAERCIKARDAYLQRDVEQYALLGKTQVQRQRINQRKDQAKRHGFAQDDEHLLSGGASGSQLLDMVDEEAKRLPQKNRISRFLSKLLPNRIRYQLQATQEAADADFHVITEFNATHEALEKRSAYTPVAFPFSRHDKYVEIPGSIQKVRNALEAETGKYVIVHGEAGIGNSALVISTGIHYEQQRKMDSPPVETPRFPDGIYYLDCGKRVHKEEQQLELLEIMGFPANEKEQTGPSQSSAETNKRSLKTKLAGKKVLIILDDLWDPEILEGVFVDGDGAEGVKYLVSSQKRDIWVDATCITPKLPEMTEARQILANYIEGRAKESIFSDEIQSIVGEIIKILEYHPLSLANVGMSILREKINDVDLWLSTLQELRDILRVDDKPRGYGMKSYPLTVEASMMLMVERLVEDKRPILPLLDLMALLSPVPESVLEWFYDGMKPTRSNSFNIELKALVEGSMIQIRTDWNTDRVLTMHGLRIHFIHEKRRSEVFATAVRLLASRKLPLLNACDHSWGAGGTCRILYKFKDSFLCFDPSGEIGRLYLLKTLSHVFDNWSSLFSSSVGTVGFYLLDLGVISISEGGKGVAAGALGSIFIDNEFRAEICSTRFGQLFYLFLMALVPILLLGLVLHHSKTLAARIPATLGLDDYLDGSDNVSVVRRRSCCGRQPSPHPDLLASRGMRMTGALLLCADKESRRHLPLQLVFVFLGLCGCLKRFIVDWKLIWDCAWASGLGSVCLKGYTIKGGIGWIVSVFGKIASLLYLFCFFSHMYRRAEMTFSIVKEAYLEAIEKGEEELQIEDKVFFL